MRFLSAHAPPRRTASRFAAGERGAAAIVFAVALPVMIGGMALGAEAGYWFMGQRELQQAADVAAHAAGVKLREGAEDEMYAAALDVAKASGFDPVTDAMPPLEHPYADDSKSVEVTLVRMQPRYFTRIYSSEKVEIGARAVAAVQEGTKACLLALSGSASPAVEIAGSALVTFEGCDVASNSSAAKSFLMSGGGSALTTGCVHTVGGAEKTANLNTDCEKLNTYAPPAANPYDGVVEPTLPGGTTCQPDRFVQDESLKPIENHSSGVKAMRFCGGLDLSGDVTLDPGLYIVERDTANGTFNVNGNANVTVNESVTGSEYTGVTFYLADGVNIVFNGSANFDLFAPKSGPYSGLLFFGSDAPTSVTHKINGTAGAVLNGAIYTPASDLDFTGDFTDDSGGCVQVVAWTVKFSGNSSLQVNCSEIGIGTRDVLVREQVRLVE